MKELIATFDWIEGKFDTRRKLANYCLKAFEKLQGYPQGTLRNPSELASSVMNDGRYLIQAIYEDGEVLYNDGWNIVEVDENGSVFIAPTAFAESESAKDGTYFSYVGSLA